jgi:hypothetical protein
LGIEDRVLWSPTMPRDALEEYYLAATISFGSFGIGGQATFATIEPMAAGSPCIASLRLDPALPFYPKDPPLFLERDAGKMSDYMADLIADPERHAEASLRAWNWVHDNCSEEVFAAQLGRRVPAPRPCAGG